MIQAVSNPKAPLFQSLASMVSENNMQASNGSKQLIVLLLGMIENPVNFPGLVQPWTLDKNLVLPLC